MHHFLSVGNDDPILGSTWETQPAQGDNLITKTFTSESLEGCSVQGTALASAKIHVLGKHMCLGCVGVGVKESNAIQGISQLALMKLYESDYRQIMKSREQLANN